MNLGWSFRRVKGNQIFVDFRFSAIRNAGTFYFSGTSNRDWTAPSNDALWQDAAKTLFDPCPAGWRVPKGGKGDRAPWRDFTAANGVWQGDHATAGRLFATSVVVSSPAWYPVSGARDWISGQSLQIGSAAYSWQTSMTAESIVYILQFNGQTVQPANSGGNHRAYGFSVRCIRE